MNLVDMRQIFALLRESAWFFPPAGFAGKQKNSPQETDCGEFFALAVVLLLLSQRSLILIKLGLKVVEVFNDDFVQH